MRLSVSPSKLEQFRLHVTEAYNGKVTKEKVIEAIQGLTPWTPKMEFGGAFHAVLENGSGCYFNPDTGLYEVPVESFDKPFILKPEEVAVADAYRMKFPKMVHEIKTKLDLPVNGHLITMHMRIDSMNGLDVHEKKTTDRMPARDKYEGSVQWRCYLLASGARRAVYDVFIYTNKEPRVIEHIQFEYDRYPGMEGEVAGWLKHFILFCENEDLLDFIKQKSW